MNFSVFSGKKSYWMILSPVLRLESGRDLINQHATELRAILKEHGFPEGDILRNSISVMKYIGDVFKLF